MFVKNYFLWVSIGLISFCHGSQDYVFKPIKQVASDSKLSDLALNSLTRKLSSPSIFNKRSSSPLDKVKSSIDKSRTRNLVNEVLKNQKQINNQQFEFFKIGDDAIKIILALLLDNCDLSQAVEFSSSLMSTNSNFIEPILDILHKNLKDNGFSKRTIAIALSKTTGGLSWLKEHVNDEKTEELNPFGITDFTYASGLNCCNAMLILFGAGADTNAVSSEGNTALILAATNNAKGSTKLLTTIQAKDELSTDDLATYLDMQNEDGNCALNIAAKEGYLEIVKILIEAGADKEIVDSEGNTPALLAIISNHKLILQYLMQHKINIKHINNDKNSALILAILLKRRDMIVIIVKAKVDLNYQDRFKRTALMYAADKKLLPVVKLLMDNNADLAIKDMNGHTAEYIAKNSVKPNKLMIKQLENNKKLK